QVEDAADEPHIAIWRVAVRRRENRSARLLAEVADRAGGQLDVEVLWQLTRINRTLHEGLDLLQDAGSVDLHVLSDKRRGAVERKQDQAPCRGAVHHRVEKALDRTGQSVARIA